MKHPITQETSRELVRREAAENGWKRETLAACDSFARRGTIVNIWWTDRDTATAAMLNPQCVAYTGPEQHAAPRMAIVQTREWLSANSFSSPSIGGMRTADYDIQPR